MKAADTGRRAQVFTCDNQFDIERQGFGRMRRGTDRASPADVGWLGMEEHIINVTKTRPGLATIEAISGQVAKLVAKVAAVLPVKTVLVRHERFHRGESHILHADEKTMARAP